MSDEPIEEVDFVRGLTVVDIGDLRVSRGLTRRPHSSCQHKRLTYDQKERRIWCRDCEKDIDGFDAFVNIAEQSYYAYADLTEKRKELAEAQQFQCRSIAAKNIDEAWRKKNMIPACPACGNGLFPEDFKNGVSMVGKEFALARRDKKR